MQSAQPSPVQPSSAQPSAARPSSLARRDILLFLSLQPGAESSSPDTISLLLISQASPCQFPAFPSRVCEAKNLSATDHFYTLRRAADVVFCIKSKAPDAKYFVNVLEIAFCARTEACSHPLAVREREAKLLYRGGGLYRRLSPPLTGSD